MRRDRLSMKMLSPEELLELRQEISGIAIPEDRADELIRLIDAIAISFIDQHFGLDSVQLSLSARANYAFSRQDSCGRVQSYDKFSAIAADNNQAALTDSAARHLAP
jgi:hypothetical protein